MERKKLYAVRRSAHTCTHADTLKDKKSARDKKCSQFPEGFVPGIALFALHVARLRTMFAVRDAFKVFIQFIRIYFILPPHCEL